LKVLAWCLPSPDVFRGESDIMGVLEESVAKKKAA